MFFKLPGMKMRVHIGPIHATPVTPADRLDEEAEGSWTIHRVSLETTEGETLSKGFGIAGRWDSAAPKEEKSSDKKADSPKADAPTPEKTDSDTSVTPVPAVPVTEAEIKAYNEELEEIGRKYPPSEEWHKANEHYSYVQETGDGDLDEATEELIRLRPRPIPQDDFHQWDTYEDDYNSSLLFMAMM